LYTKLGDNTVATKILFVDDDETMLETIAELLESFGFDVIKAVSADSAIEILRGVKVEAVLTDFMMPGMSGLSFAQNCAQNQPNVPIVIYTGADIGDVASGNSNVHSVLKKPVSPVVLIETIRKAISETKDIKLKKSAEPSKLHSGKP
jgi:CheY-like chemotaxis protein